MADVDGSDGAHLPQGVEPLVVDADWAQPSSDGRGGGEAPAAILRRERHQFMRLRQVMARVNQGLHLDEVLDFVFEDFRDIIPYHRIAFATIDYDQQRIVARWARSDGMAKFPVGYWHPFDESSLMAVAEHGRPRIINDLAGYVRDHPDSEVTQMLVDEALLSSLTCPLEVNGRAVGFLFFDHQQRGIYGDVHVGFFMQIAAVIAAAVERARLFSELTEYKETIEKQNRQLAEENRRNLHELAMARTVQRSLITESLPTVGGLEMAMLYEPAEMIGGDLLDAIRLDDRRVLVTVADAMGHGVPAALLMTVVRTALHGAVTLGVDCCAIPSPAELLSKINRTIVDLFQSNYVTAICAIVDAVEGSVRMSLAGHPPALVARAGDHRVVQLDKGQIPLGIEATTEYFDIEAPFGQGDTLMFYTDGVIEAAAPDRSQYGLEALRRLMANSCGLSARQLADALRSDLERHCDGASLDDDMAILTVYRG